MILYYNNNLYKAWSETGSYNFYNYMYHPIFLVSDGHDPQQVEEVINLSFLLPIVGKGVFTGTVLYTFKCLCYGTAEDRTHDLALT